MAKEPKTGLVLLEGARCRCGHQWRPRKPGRPGVCPKCKSYNWDKLYVRDTETRKKRKGKK